MTPSREDKTRWQVPFGFAPFAYAQDKPPGSTCGGVCEDWSGV
jgi:hypothetical protein